MANDNETYQETVARLRQEAAERNINNLQFEANRLNSELVDLEAQAVDADSRGETDVVDMLMVDVQQKAQQLNGVLAQLPQQPQFSEQKLQWMQRRPELVNDPRFPQTADAWHKYLTEVVGVQDDSPQYAEMMTSALEPQGYQPVPSADEVVKTIRETSKYGKDLTAKEYNRHVAPAQQHVAAQLKAQGRKF